MPRNRQKNRLKLRLITAAVIVGVIISLGLWLHYRVTTPVLANPPLKTLAARQSLSLGNFAITSHLDDQIYTNILTSQFDFVLADNTPNWYFTDGGLRPGPSSYNFKQMDQIVQFAASHNMPIQAHHYVWGEEKWLPDWLKNGHYSRQQLLQFIHDHIMTVGSHYKGRIAEWSVVNEAFSRGEHIYGLRDWWADNIGDQSYIDDSFIWARQADPNSKLILNDFGNETANPISDAMYNYIRSAKTRGVPIDGLGMQMHIDGTNPPAKDSVIANMRRFAGLGVAIYVTEFDVNMGNVPGTIQQKDQKEADIYYQMMRACIESKVCHSFAYLGITDKESWYNYLGIRDSRPLMFDTKYHPKPAYYATRVALSLQ